MQFEGDKMPVTLCITEKVKDVFLRKDKILQNTDFILFLFHHTLDSVHFIQ